MEHFGILDEKIDNNGCKYNISHSYSFQIFIIKARFYLQFSSYIIFFENFLS